MVFLPEIIHNIILQLIKFGLISLVLTLTYKIYILYIYGTFVEITTVKRFLRLLITTRLLLLPPDTVYLHNIIIWHSRRFHKTSREIVFKFKNENKSIMYYCYYIIYIIVYTARIMGSYLSRIGRILSFVDNNAYV